MTPRRGKASCSSFASLAAVSRRPWRPWRTPTVRRHWRASRWDLGEFLAERAHGGAFAGARGAGDPRKQRVALFERRQVAIERRALGRRRLQRAEAVLQLHRRGTCAGGVSGKLLETARSGLIGNAGVGGAAGGIRTRNQLRPREGSAAARATAAGEHKGRDEHGREAPSSPPDHVRSVLHPRWILATAETAWPSTGPR